MKIYSVNLQNVYESMQTTIMTPLIGPVAFISIGFLLMVKPQFIARWLKSFARPIGRESGVKILSQKVQEKQATSRPLFIRILGTLFFGVGLWSILQVLPRIVG